MTEIQKLRLRNNKIYKKQFVWKGYEILMVSQEGRYQIECISYMHEKTNKF